MHKFIRAYDDQPTIPANIDIHKILDVSIAGDKTQVTYDRYSA